LLITPARSAGIEGIDVNATGSPAENEKAGQKGKVLAEL
jgi:hypothetical protein